LPILLIWLQFALCAVVIGVAGVRLSRYGDAIATLTGLSRNWVGMILLGHEHFLAGVGHGP
jgi:cation:H+ antiporter